MSPSQPTRRLFEQRIIIRRRMIALIIVHADFCEEAFRRDIRFDPFAPFGFVPIQIEGGQFGIEPHVLIRQMVMNKPRKCRPVSSLVIESNKSVHDDRRRRAQASLFIAPVKNMMGAIILIGTAVQFL